jgi:hypothetical protein
MEICVREGDRDRFLLIYFSQIRAIDRPLYQMPNVP